MGSKGTTLESRDSYCVHCCCTSCLFCNNKHEQKIILLLDVPVPGQNWYYYTPIMEVLGDRGLEKYRIGRGPYLYIFLFLACLCFLRYKSMWAAAWENGFLLYCRKLIVIWLAAKNVKYQTEIRTNDGSRSPTHSTMHTRLPLSSSQPRGPVIDHCRRPPGSPSHRPWQGN
jgi:hypothetical protein